MQQFKRRVTTPHRSCGDDLESLRKATDPALRPARAGKRAAIVVAGGLALTVLGWALAILFIEELRFAILAPRAQAGVEAGAAFARLFGALVLGLFFVERSGERLRGASCTTSSGPRPTARFSTPRTSCGSSSPP